MFRILRSSFSWSQIHYFLVNNFSKQCSSFGKNTKGFSTVQRSKIQGIHSLQRSQHHLLGSFRFHGNFQEQADNTNMVERKAMIQNSAMGARISKKRQEWQASFRDLISNKDGLEWQTSDWELVAKKMSLSGGPKWEVLCMHTLYKDKNLALGRSLMSYLEQQAQSPSQITLTFYFGLLGETSTSSEQDDEAKVIYDRLLQVSDFLDPASIEVKL